MPYTPEAYVWNPVKYVGESGSIPALPLYERGGLSYVRFRVQSAWPYYDGWSKWITVGLCTEHVVTADPHEPAVANLFGELEREAARMRRYANGRYQPNGQHATKSVEHRVPQPEKPEKKLRDIAKVEHEGGSGMRRPPKSAPARGRRARANAADVHSLKPVRTIAGLTIADFLYDR